MVDSACRDTDEPDLFFPEKGKHYLLLEAQTVCLSCPVVHECREYGQRIGADYGLWGGIAKRRGGH